MARKTKRSKSKKKKSNPPALRTLVYQLTGGASGATQTDNYIDLAYGLSLVNRRLYEQGRQYHIKRIQVIPFAGSSPATYSFIEAEVLPTHWSMYAAYKKTKDLWKQMRTGRGGAPGSGLPEGLTPATWADFKIYSSEQHYDARATVNVPLDGDGSSVSTTGAEWVYSTFNMPDDTDSADEFTVHMIGDDSGSDESWNSVGMIKGYAESRRTVQVDDSDAGIQTSTWMINLLMTVILLTRSPLLFDRKVMHLRTISTTMQEPRPICQQKWWLVVPWPTRVYCRRPWPCESRVHGSSLWTTQSQICC